MPFGQLEYTVTFRIDSKSPQQELKRYTKEAANNFADGIVAMGGVAIITEGICEEPISDELVNPHEARSLKW